MAPEVDRVRTFGEQLVASQLADLGFVPADELGPLYFWAPNTTCLGRTGVRVMGRIQKTRLHSKAWVVNVTAFAFSEEVRSTLALGGFDTALPETVAASLRGLEERTPRLSHQKEIVTNAGAEKLARSITETVTRDFAWWCRQFEDLASTYSYLSLPDVRNAARNCHVGAALAMLEGDSNMVMQFAWRRLLEFPVGVTEDFVDGIAEWLLICGKTFSLELSPPSWEEYLSRR